MAQIIWQPTKTGKTTKNETGVFSTAADWVGGVLPGTNDIAELGSLGVAYTVDSTASASVTALTTAKAATLDVQAGTLSATEQYNGDDSLKVESGATFQVGGGGATEPFAAAMTNKGTVNLIGGASAATLAFDAAQVTLGGGGAINMTGAQADSIGVAAGLASGANVLLTVQAHTLSGAGTIGGAQMSLDFSALATVNANSATEQSLTLTAASPIINQGTLEATADGALVINSSIENEGVIKAVGANPSAKNASAMETVTINNARVYGTGSLVANGATATIALNNATVAQAISIANNSQLIATGTDALLGSTVANRGKISAGNGVTLEMTGSLVGNGALDLVGAGSATTLEIMAGELALSGGGSVMLGATGATSTTSRIIGAGAGSELYNINDAIKGSGTVGDGTLAIFNGAAGAIESTGVGMTLLGGAGSSTPSSNLGVIGTANNANLTIEGSWAGGYVRSNGSWVRSGAIQANGSSTVTFNNADIVDESLAVATGANVDVTGGASDVLSGVISNKGHITAADDVLVLGNTVNNSGTITFEAGSGATDWLKFHASNGVTTFTGNGDVVFAGAGADDVGSGGGVQAWSNVSNTISGAADINDSLLTLINGTAGKIDANTSGETFTINTGANAVQNNGLMEATNGGELVVESAVTGTGTIGVGAGSTVELGSTWANKVSFLSGASSGAPELLKLDVSMSETGLMKSYPLSTTVGEIYGFNTANYQSIEIGDVLGSTGQYLSTEHAYSNGQSFTDVLFNVGGTENAAQNGYTNGKTFELVFNGLFANSGQPTFGFTSTNGHLTITYTPAATS